MRLNKKVVMILVISFSFLIIVKCVCPNSCSSHGRCVGSACECFKNVGFGNSESYGGADCSERLCFVGNPFSAVHSRSPSESGVSYSRVNRVLGGYTISNRRLDESSTSGSISLISTLDGEKGKLWKVSGLKDFLYELPPSGGVLSCRFYNQDASPTELLDTPTSVDVLGIGIDEKGKDYGYVRFKGGVKKIGNSPSEEPSTPIAEGAAEYSSVVCDSVISTRDDFSQLNPKEETATGEGAKPFTWEHYGPILYDMGLLPDTTKNEEDGEPKPVYKNDKFRFACYPKEPKIDTPVTVYDNVEAVYDYNVDNNVKFTFKGENPSAAASMCFCMMNSNGIIDVEYSEIFNNLRNENGKYFIGKYPAESKIVYEGNNPVLVLADSSIADKVITITLPADVTEEQKLYFDENRVVYATILKDGLFKEEAVPISGDKVTVTKEDGDLIMPYLRTSPLNESTKLPETKIVPTDTPFIYKAYYFAEDLLHSFNKEGGILKCKYDQTETTIDVTGIVRNDQEIFFSYIESSIENLDAKKLICSEISYIRKDFTLLNPATFTTTTPAPPVKERQLADDMTWDNYGSLFKINKISSVDFACFNIKSQTKEMGLYTADVTTPENDKVKFSITNMPTVSEATTYLCYLLHEYSTTPPPSSTLSDLPNSDMGNRIKVENGKYYYGEFVLGDKSTLGKRENNEEVIILNKDSEIKIEATGSPPRERILADKIITITGYKPEDDFDMTKKLVKDTVFHLKFINSDTPYNEIYVKYNVGEGGTTMEENYRKVKISASTTDSTDLAKYSPFYVIYLSENEPTDIPTTQPPQPPTTVTAIDSNSNLYEIKNYITDELLNELPKIGGKLQCKSDANKVEIVDVKGVKKDKNNKVISGYYEFESRESIDRIVSCKIISIRNDMTVYKTIKYDNGLNIIWSGYGTILSEIGYNYSPKNLTCYTPASDIKDINNRILSFYEVKLSNIKQNEKINDLKISFTDNNKKPNNVGDICYLLSDVDGGSISIEESDLWKSVRKEGDKYYYGKNVINTDGKSEESKSEDGSVKISFIASESILLKEPDDPTADDTGDKMNIFKLNDASSPSFEIPPSYIGLESAKMLYAGTTVTFIFNGENRQSSQILKVETSKIGNNERYKILLSDPINYPTTPPRRLRSLAGDNISPDLLVDLEWTSEGSTHIAIECSGQGVCDRSSGICKCYNGYSGSGCQRLDCPNNCNGNGRCVALSELLSNDELLEYKGYGNKHESKVVSSNTNTNGKTAQFDNQVFGCLCDKRHRGYDCSLIECPSGKDPEAATNMPGADDEKRDCSGRGICDYKSGICECFDGFSGEGCQNTVSTM